MTKNDVILKVFEGKITQLQGADILGYSARHMRRLMRRYDKDGYDGLRDQRGKVPRRTRIKPEVITEVIRLKREQYADFNVAHFHEKLTEEHGIKLSYSWTKVVLQEAKLVDKAPGRGKYRRKRDRRPMRGMMLHFDGSTHEWIPGLPMWDLMWLMDDATSEVLYACFVPEENTLATLAALKHVLQTNGRFCELYTDRGSHFCRTSEAGNKPDEEQNGQVPRALDTLGIRHIRGFSPQARGRGERAFGTIQGRLPQELKAAGISDYQAANRYLQDVFMPGFNRRFSVEPAEQGSAFTPLVGIELDLLLSKQTERTVSNDHTVSYKGQTLQIPKPVDRLHLVRCKVRVHEFPEGHIGISYAGRLIARGATATTLRSVAA